MAGATTFSDVLTHAFAAYWWVLVVRGVASMAIGLVALAWPGVTLASLIVLYGAYCLADSVIAFTGGARNRAWYPVFAGVCSLGAGLLAFAYPGLTAAALVFLIAGWAVVRGVLEIVMAIDLRRILDHELLLAAAGALSILFGVYLFLFPVAGALAVVWMLGLYALIFGALLTIAGFRIRHLV
jgi:uncharacterized membrane protein HdeD (DUF308 family)